MAVAPTGAIYKALKFDNVSSRTYGVYITGEAVYNAPERDVEMITIPGRSGSFALDNGRFENITVTYPAGIFAETEADFRDAISEFRNFLCSRKGYVRLQDEYNPNEYRMAVYKSGLEVEPAMLKAGEFDIVFDCKPQRWLTSGETAVSVTSGDTLTNPTLFEASPLLEVEGYGSIQINGYDIQLVNGQVGDVTLWDEYIDENNMSTQFSKSVSIPKGLLNTNDTITIDGFWLRGYKLVTMAGASTTPVITITSSSHSGVQGATMVPFGEAELRGDAYSVRMGYLLTFPSVQLSYGTPLSLVDTESAYYTVTKGSSYTGNYELHLETSLVYDGDSTVTFALQRVGGNGQGFNYRKYVIPVGIGASTKTILGQPTYIDCDLGEAYKIEDGAVVSLNQYIDLGSKLPTLSPGSNAITYDNTITDFKVVPNWWKV